MPFAFTSPFSFFSLEYIHLTHIYRILLLLSTNIFYFFQEKRKDGRKLLLTVLFYRLCHDLIKTVHDTESVIHFLP